MEKPKFDKVKMPEVNFDLAEYMSRSGCKLCYGRGFIEYNPSENLYERHVKYCSCTKKYRKR